MQLTNIRTLPVTPDDPEPDLTKAFPPAFLALLKRLPEEKQGILLEEWLKNWLASPSFAEINIRTLSI